MAQIDEFARTLLEEAKRFLERAEGAAEVSAHSAYLHAALLLAFSSLEAHVNAISDDFIDRPEVSVHERGFMAEREIRMESGQFVLRGTRITKLEDRIQFLHARFGRALDNTETHWGRLAEATKLRNQLTHPKETLAITKQEVGRAIQAIIDTLDSLYHAIYGRGFPSANRGLDSKLIF